jgi:excisionase family DNA binding protein
VAFEPSAAGDRAPPPEVLTLAEAAGLLRASPDDVAALAAAGRLPGRQLGDGWRFGRSAVLAWLDGFDGAVPTAGEPDAGGVDRAPPRPIPGRADGGAASGVVAAERAWAAVPPGDKSRLFVATAATDPAAGPPSDRGVFAADAPMSAADLGSVRGLGTAGAPPTSGSQASGSQGDEPETIGEAPERRRAEEVALRREGVLLRQGEMTLELDAAYTKGDAPVGLRGPFLTSPTNRDAFSGAFVARYGVIDDLQLVIGSTLVSSRDQAVPVDAFGEPMPTTRWTTFNDVALAVRYAALPERQGYPSVVVTAEGRVPVANTPYAFGGRISLVKSVDPVALFADVGYLHQLGGSAPQPFASNVFSGSFGYAFAVNDTLSLSTRLTGVFTRGTDLQGVPQLETERFFLQFGLTTLLSEGLFLEPTVSFALNGPSSVTLGLSLPFTFTP